MLTEKIVKALTEAFHEEGWTGDDPIFWNLVLLQADGRYTLKVHFDGLTPPADQEGQLNATHN